MSNFTKKPFDLEYMKANPETKLQTRDGREVTEWHYFETCEYDYCIICIIKGMVSFTKEGFSYKSKKDSLLDLFMLVPCEEKVFFANVNENGFGNFSFKTIEETKNNKNWYATHIIKITTSEGNPPTFEIVHRY